LDQAASDAKGTRCCLFGEAAEAANKGAVGRRGGGTVTAGDGTSIDALGEALGLGPEYLGMIGAGALTRDCATGTGFGCKISGSNRVRGTAVSATTRGRDGGLEGAQLRATASAPSNPVTAQPAAIRLYPPRRPVAGAGIAEVFCPVIRPSCIFRAIGHREKSRGSTPDGATFIPQAQPRCNLVQTY
jgi:hypothetical protein